MRKIQSVLLVAMIMSTTTLVKAQFSKGQRMVGASIASLVYNSGSSDITVTSIGSNTSKITSYNVNIMPSMGWFVSDQTVIGATVNINPNGNKTSYTQNGVTYQSDKYNTYNLGIGGFVRYYLHSQSKMLPFGQFSLNGGVSNLKTSGFFYGGSGANAYKITYNGNSTSGSFMNASFTAGFTKMLNTNTGLDFYLGYTYSNSSNVFKKTTLRDNGNDGTIDERLENETTTKFTNNGFLLGVGLQVFLGKKK
jgi:hypothetical protein